MRAQEIALHTASACIRRTVGACHLQAKLLCVILKADRASHLSLDSKKERTCEFNFKPHIYEGRIDAGYLYTEYGHIG